MAKGDVRMVRDALPLPLTCPFKIVASGHVASESAIRRAIGNGKAFTLLVVFQGHLDLDAGNGRVSLGPGEAFLIEPRGRGSLTLSYGTDAEFFLVQFLKTEQPLSALQHRLEVPEHAAIRNPGRLKHLLGMFIEETGRQVGSRMVLHHLMVLMLCEMASSSLVKGGSMAREDSLESMASRVDAYIAAHYHEPTGTPDIAQDLRYNPDYLERAYHSERHMSIREAIHVRRIREACAQLLLQRTRSIAEIAAQCGYVDAGNFRRAFKQAFSMTPHEYRALNAPNRGSPQPVHSL
jgi:AraC-like DNA-binding protein